jgi:diguanylate cyclase (GGDEF)-like protein
MTNQLNRTLLTLTGLGVTSGILLLAGFRLITSSQQFNLTLVLGLCCLAGVVLMLALSYRMFAQIRLLISDTVEDKLSHVLKQTSTMLNATKRIKNDQQGLLQLLNTLSEAAWIKDSNNQFIFANNHLGKLLNVDSSILVNARDQVPASEFLTHLDHLDQQVLQLGESQQIEIATGNDFLFSVRSEPIKNSEGQVAGVVAYAEDISANIKQQSAEEKWRLVDPLTSLGNRKLAERWLTDAIQSSQANQQSVAVLFVDIDDFALLNDNLTPNLADQCLQEVAQRLAAMVSENCMAVRLSADQFALLFSHIDNPQLILELANRIQQSLTQPILLGEHSISLNISLGMARFPDHGSDPWSLVMVAEKDMQTMRQQLKAN